MTMLFIGCNQPVPTGGGSGSQTGNPVISGKLLTDDGKPAVGAVVRFIPVSQTLMPGNKKAAGGEYTCVTDENGMYGFDSLPDTLYNVFGEGQGDMSFRDSVIIEKKDSTRIPTDTLKAPGSIYGIVRLQPEHSSRTVLILLPGTSTFVIPGDSIGHFAIPRMARGTYPARILTTLDDYKPKDTAFTIRCGMSDTLKDTLRLEYTGIPVVTGVKAVLDSLRINVIVSWNRIDTALVAGYNVYRGTIDSTFGTIPINKTLVKDTFYVDEDLIQRQGQRMVYKVKAVNGNGDVSKSFSEGSIALVASSYSATDSIIMNDWPRRVVVNNSGDLFIQLYWTAGKLLKFPYGLNSPTDIFFADSSNNLLSDMAFSSFAIDDSGCFYGISNLSLVKFNSQGIFIKTVINDTAYTMNDIAIRDTVYVLVQGEKQEIKVFNREGDSLANWVISESPVGSLGIFTSMAVLDSFIVIASMRETRLLDRFSGAIVSQFTQPQWMNSSDGPLYYGLDLSSNGNELYVLNLAQGRIYHISTNGKVLGCCEIDIHTCRDFEPNEIVIGKYGKAYLPLVTASKILIFENMSK